MDGSRLHRSSDGGAVTPPTISYDQLAAWKEEGVPLPPRPIMFDVDHPVKGVLGIARVLMQTGRSCHSARAFSIVRWDLGVPTTHASLYGRAGGAA